MRCRITISVALAMWAGWGCAGEETPTQVVPPEHAQVSTAGAADWAKPAGPDDVVVATVQGVPITREMVLAVQEASPGLDARGALERLIDLEVLAQRARQLGLDEAVRVREARRQGLVQRFLRKGFEPEVTPETLPLEQAKELYYVPDVRKLYDHTDAWRMAHIFFTCCDPKMEDCTRPEFLQCFDESSETIKVVFDELKTLTADVEGDVDKLVPLLETYRTDNETRFLRHPFAFRTRAFYYDPKKPHEEQKGYDIIAEGVARTVIEGELGVLQPPIQSPFGWHVIVKLDHDPEDRRGPDDPDVIADIRKNMLPKMRQVKFRALLGTLAQERGVTLDPAPLEQLNVRFNARL